MYTANHCTTQRFFLIRIFSAVDACRGTLDVTMTTVVLSSWRRVCWSCADASDARVAQLAWPSWLSRDSPLRRLLWLAVAAVLTSSGSAICNSVREIRECVMMKSALRRSSPLAWNGLFASSGSVGLPCVNNTQWMRRQYATLSTVLKHL